MKKLSLKQCLQWYTLVLLKEQPLTVDECHKLLQQRLPPPPQPGSPKRKYSIHKIRTYLKELEELGEVVSVQGSTLSYSITKKGHHEEQVRLIALEPRIERTDHALKVISEQLRGMNERAPKIVPIEDREFVRSLLSVKDVVRVFILNSLHQRAASFSELQNDMIAKWGWTCSKSYFLLVGRNEMTEGVDEDNEPLPSPVILLTSTYTGNVQRRFKREYRIKDEALAAEWYKIYLESAQYSVKEAGTFTSHLLSTLHQIKKTMV